MSSKEGLKNIMRRYTVLIVLWAFFVPAGYGNAATFDFTQSTIKTVYTIGDTVTVGIYVNTDSQAINAVSAKIQYPSQLIKLISISKTDTAIDFWTIGPYEDDSTVVLEGIVLNPGITNSGLIATLQFSSIDSGQATIEFLDGAILANDGKATNILSGLPEITFAIQALSTHDETQPMAEEESDGQITTPIEEDAIIADSIFTKSKFDIYQILIFVSGIVVLLLLLLAWYLQYKKKANTPEDTFRI